MNRTTVIIVAAGFVFALIAAVAVQMISGPKAPPAAEAAKTISVLVASRDIDTGEDVGPTNLAWATWPESSKFEGALLRDGLQRPEEALKGRVRRTISKGEPMSASMMLTDTNAGFVAASLAPGKRAVTLNTNAQSAVGGFINPGDFVDVILTYDIKLPSDEKVRKAAATVVTKLAAETVVEKLRVLAIDQETKKSIPKVGKTVTLEADPKQAEILALASKMGTLSFALRTIGDETSIHDVGHDGGDTPYQTTTDLRLSGVMREITGGENKSGSLTQVVRVYNGSRVDNIEVRPSTNQ